jgi:hypothetical protein
MATCPKCRRHFRTLEDEEGMHECPRCGYAPWHDESNDEPDEPPCEHETDGSELDRCWKCGEEL